MAERPVFLPNFGRFLVELRELRGWRQTQAADIAQRRGLIALTRQVLIRLEAGRTKNPDRDVIESLSSLYGVPTDELTARYLAESRGLDLLRPPPEYQSEIPKGGADVPASAAQAGFLNELERLRKENAALQAQVDDLREAADSLISIAYRGTGSRTAASHKSGGRRRGRKTG